MSICHDQSTTFLRNLGYNVVRHPTAKIRPLDLIGKQGGETAYLGRLNQLVRASEGGMPAISDNEESADIGGQSSSKMSLAIGANVLANLIGAMGGNLGLTTSYTDAQRVEFKYTDVLEDSAIPLSVGDYLREAEVDAGNLILQQYVLGRGQLFLITKTAKSKKFMVKYERKNEGAAKVDVPALQALAGLNVKVESVSEREGITSFTGSTPLIFGFQCFRVGVANGDLTLTSVRAGNVALKAGEEAINQPDLLDESGAVDLKFAL